MCQHVHVYHGLLIYYKYLRAIYVLFLGFKTTIKKYHPFHWYQAWCCKVAFSQRDFQQCDIKRSSLERRYYVLAELTKLLYVNTKDLIKIRNILIRVVSLYFVSCRYKSILVGSPLTSYINTYSFIYYSKGVTKFISFLLQLATEPEFRNFGYSNGEKGNLQT